MQKSMPRNGKKKLVRTGKKRKNMHRKQKQRLRSEDSRTVIWRYFYQRIMVVLGQRLMSMHHTTFFARKKLIDWVGEEIGCWHVFLKLRNGRWIYRLMYRMWRIIIHLIWPMD